jgi:hypothetical protein
MSVHYYSHRHFHAYVPDRAQALYRATEVVWYLAYIVEGLLLIRFLLRLLGANPAAPFAGLIYAISEVILAPFEYILPAVQESSHVLEWGTLIAAGAYWLVAWAAQKILLMILPLRDGVSSKF